MRWITPLILTLAATAAAQPIVIDHTCTDIGRIPAAWIEQAAAACASATATPRTAASSSPA